MLATRSVSCRVLLVAIALAAISASSAAADITLQWDANTETDLAGYKIYVGTAAGVYTTPIVIGTQTTATITNLAPGTYYFAVTAYNTAGLESGFSNEVSTTITGTANRCDLNGDGFVNVLDLQRMINAILGIQALTGGTGDLNGDSAVNVLDLQILGNVILGLRSCPL